MKRIRTIVVWSIFCLVIECGILFYMDQFLFKHSSSFTLVEVDDKEKIEEYEVTIPESVEDIKASFNGKYLSYKVYGNLYLVDCKSGETEEIITTEDREVLFSDWLSDRNRIVVAVKTKNESNKDIIELTNYDTKSKEEKKVKEVCNYYKGMKVNNVVTTTLSGVSYMGISREGYNSPIYRIDINEDMEKVSTKVSSIGEMEVFPHKDMLIYEDSINSKFYKYSNSETKLINFNSKSKLKLLSLDDDGTVYMGKLSGNQKVKEIIYGKLEENISSWSTKILDEEKEITEIYINSHKEILINDSVNEMIINLNEDKNTKYKGNLVEIKNEVIVSVIDNKIYIKKF